MANIFKKEFKISSFDLNPGGKARLTSLANFFQEAAYHHASELGLGYDDLKSRKTIWVLSRMRIHMQRYPVWNDSITIETWPSGAEKLFALRDFRVLDSKGEVIGMATTAWLILDIHTHRLIRPKEIIDQFKMIIHKVQMFDKALDKISIPGETKLLLHHAVSYSDLDIVGHVNNVKFIEWCLDALSTDNNSEQDIGELEINYLHEALLGDTIQMDGYRHPGGEYYFKATREADGTEIIVTRLKRK